MKKTTKRFLSLLLSVLMLLSLTVTAALAAPPPGDMPGGPGGPGGGPGGPGGPGGAPAEPDPNSPHFTAKEGADLDPVIVGSFGSDYAAPRYSDEAVTNKSGTAAIDDSTSWHNGALYYEAGEYTLGGSIKMNTKADGSDTNDFSGLGAAVMAVGQGVVLKIENANIETTGVAKLALFTDDGAVSIVKSSTLTANGGVIYDGYMSTADQAMMVSPPWVLGLGGNAAKPVNARTTNLMGNYSVAAYIDSTFNAAGWGALSVDSGTNMHMVIINSEVNVTDAAGYGAYTIGESTEDYYGVKMDVTTYANIMTGGKATYQSYTGGQEVQVEQYGPDSQLEYTFAGMTGEPTGIAKAGTGKTVATVASDKVAAGTKVVSTIKADEFGFMCHANGSDNTNVVNLLDGTEVESGDAIFLVKKVNAVLTVDSAKLTSGNNTIVQIIDNDDDYVGLDFAAEWGVENLYGHTYGSHMPTFNSRFHEEAGYSNQWIAESSAAGKPDYSTGGNWTVTYNMTNATAAGDLWNSTGYVGSNPATTLAVNLGKGADLTGIISAGAFSHTTKDATVGSGDWTGADALGHVTNIVNSNGVNLVNVTLTDDAAWKVTGDCTVTNLTAAGAAITADKAVTVNVTGTLTLDGKAVTEDTTVGNVTYTVVKAEEPAPQPQPEPQPAPQPQPQPAPSGEYTVVAGDSLWKIAAKQLGDGTKWNLIYEANRATIKDPAKIYVGQTLVIPGK